MAAPPVPSSSNNQPRGWISRSNSSQNFTLMVDTCAPKSTKIVTSHPSTTTGASLARPTNCATRSGFRNGMDSMFFCPLCFPASFWVSCGSGLQRECLVLITCDWREVWPHSPGSPLPCLMVPQELHILLPYGPSPDTYSTGESWSPWHPVGCLAHRSMHFGSPCMGTRH